MCRSVRSERVSTLQFPTAPAVALLNEMRHEAHGDLARLVGANVVADLE
jgi:hypothetical protein